MYLFIVFYKDLLCFIFHFGSRTFIWIHIFVFWVFSDLLSLRFYHSMWHFGISWQSLLHFSYSLVISWHTFSFIAWLYSGRSRGGMDCATASTLSLEQLITALLIIVNELCHRFRIPLSSAASVPLPTQPDLGRS